VLGGKGMRPVPQAENAPMGKRFAPVAKNSASVPRVNCERPNKAPTALSRGNTAARIWPEPSLQEAVLRLHGGEDT
jgi:hypothetical protein